MNLRISYSKSNRSSRRAGLKGRGARDNFHWRAPMTYFMTSSFV